MLVAREIKSKEESSAQGFEILFNIKNGHEENLESFFSNTIDDAHLHEDIISSFEHLHESIGYVCIDSKPDRLTRLNLIMSFIYERHNYLRKLISDNDISLIPYICNRFPDVILNNKDLYLFAIDDEKELSVFRNLCADTYNVILSDDIEYNTSSFPLIMGLERDTDPQSDTISIYDLYPGKYKVVRTAESYSVLQMTTKILGDIQSIVYNNMQNVQFKKKASTSLNKPTELDYKISKDKLVLINNFIYYMSDQYYESTDDMDKVDIMQHMFVNACLDKYIYPVVKVNPDTKLHLGYPKIYVDGKTFDHYKSKGIISFIAELSERD